MIDVLLAWAACLRSLILKEAFSKPEMESLLYCSLLNMARFFILTSLLLADLVCLKSNAPFSASSFYFGADYYVALCTSGAKTGDSATDWSIVAVLMFSILNVELR